MRGALVGLIISAVAAPVEAPRVEAPTRGRTWLTGAGLASLGAAVAAATLGIQFVLMASDARASVTAYLPTPESVPAEADAAAVARLKERSQRSSAAGAALLIAAGVLVAAGVTAVVLDAPARATVSVAPTSGGAVVVLEGRW